METSPQQMITHWNLEPGRLRPDIPLCGSPERCTKRWAIEDADGVIWILEKLFPGQEERRLLIGNVLCALAEDFPNLPPYKQTPSGGFVLSAEGRHWQLSNFISHDPLQRPEYIHDKEKGESLGQCLALLRAVSDKLDTTYPEAPFAIPSYIEQLVQTITQRAPGIAGRVQELHVATTPFLKTLPTLPTAFCHGDCHPLNVLWRDNTAHALIDWEFCAIRPALYDVANCLGCVGIEDPRALNGGFAQGLLSAIRPTMLNVEDAHYLPEMLLAVRFAWLSEWLRHRDGEMIELELDYMELILRNVERLREVWGLNQQP